jgi:unsaturated rhamnogalacturonyl hydrolase
VVGLVACGNSGAASPGDEAGPPASQDAASTQPAPSDAGMEGATDAATTPPVDATTDAGPSTVTDSGSPPPFDAGISQASVATLIDKVVTWQLGQLNAASDTDDGWVNAVFYAGLMAAYGSTHNATYATAATTWASANQWTVPTSGTGPDNQCCGQTYLELNAVNPAPLDIAAIQSTIDQTIATTTQGRTFLSYADALFMSPPGMVRLGAAVDAGHYFDDTSRLWWDAVGVLYDADAGLFWRDSSYIGKTCGSAGAPEFWARGNGWVIAGTVRVLEYLPATHPARPQFVQLLSQMAAAAAQLQRTDGYWSSCMTDSADYPEPETSGTAGLTYGITWGLNAGLLDPATYLPVVQSAWRALASVVASTGEVQWVQPVGTAPAQTAQTDTAPYGAGLWLLAASEVYRLP